MRYAFNQCTTFDQPLSNWDTSKVKYTEAMFAVCTLFNQNINNWNTSQITDMGAMFSSCINFNQPLNNWDTSKVITMDSMFKDCCLFNQDISGWDTSKVIDMDYMFQFATVFNCSLSKWNVSNIESLPNKFAELTLAWYESKPLWGTIGDMQGHTTNVTVTTTNDSSNFRLSVNELVGSWALYRDDVLISTRTSTIAGVDAAFANKGVGIDLYQAPDTVSVYKLYATGPRLFLTNLSYDQSNTTFSVTQFSDGVDRFNFDTRNANLIVPTRLPSYVTNLSYMFDGAYRFNQDISSWDTSNVTNMYLMFSDARSFNQNIGLWNTVNVVNMQEMFAGASIFNQDLSKWNVLNVTMRVSFDDRAFAWTKYKPQWDTDGNQPIISNDWTEGLAIDYPGTGWYKATDTGTVFCKDIPDAEICKFGDDDSSGYVSVYAKAYARTYGSRAATSNMTDMSELFKDNVNFDDNIESWDTSNVTNMDYMFDGANAFNKPLNNWNVSNVTSMMFMFNGCSLFDQPLNNWVTSTVTNMSTMFKDCSLFNQDINSWNIGNVVDCSRMFENTNTFNQPLDNWDVSSVQVMHSMFNYAIVFNQDIGMWNTDLVSDMDYMFKGASLFNQDLSGWNVLNIVSEPLDFRLNATAYVLPPPVWGTDGTNVSPLAPKGLAIDYPGTGWYKATDTGTVFCKDIPDGESAIFSVGGTEYVSVYSKADARLYSSRAATSNMTDMSELFQSLNEFNDNLITWDTSNVTNMSYMFAYSGKYDQPLDNWDVSKVTNMAFMFRYTNKFNQPLNNWNTGSVTNMSQMFSNATKFNQDISNWNVGNVTTMEYMFDECAVFNKPLNTWNTSKLTNMRNMFNKCKLFNQDLGDWNVSKVTNMRNTFALCAVFNQDLSRWNTISATDMFGMFSGCYLFNQDLSSWNVLKISSKPLAFDGNNDVWLLPKPYWGVNVYNTSFSLVDITGASGVYLTASRDGINFQTINISDPAFDSLEFQSFMSVSQDNTGFAYFAWPDYILPEEMQEGDSFGISGLNKDGTAISTRYPNGYTLTKPAVLNPYVSAADQLESVTPPFTIVPAKNVITVKATQGVPAENDIFNTLVGTVPTGIIRVTSDAVVLFN